MDQFDPWQYVPRQVFTSYFRLLISTVFVVVSHVGCLGVTSVFIHNYRSILICLRQPISAIAQTVQISKLIRAIPLQIYMKHLISYHNSFFFFNSLTTSDENSCICKQGRS